MPKQQVTKPLTPKMLEVLRELAKPGAKAYYMQYMGRFNQTAYYFLSTNHKHCTAQIEALLRRQLVIKFDREQYNAGHKVRISDAGRKYLQVTRPPADNH
jgi:hypothetical protein